MPNTATRLVDIKSLNLDALDIRHLKPQPVQQQVCNRCRQPLPYTHADHIMLALGFRRVCEACTKR